MAFADILYLLSSKQSNMITDIVLAFLSPFVALVGLFLHGIGLAIPDAFEIGLTNFLSYLKYFVDIFPVATLIQVMTFGVLAEFAFLTFKLGMWGFHMMPFGKKMTKG